MKKLFYLVAIAMISLATSCSSGYDQKKVDALDKNNYTEDDYYEMVKQAGYALDDAEGAKDLAKWEEDNAEEAQSMMGLVMALAICQEADPNFPKDLNKEVEKLGKRLDKLTAGMNLPDLSDVDFDDTELVEYVESVGDPAIEDDYDY